VLVWLEGHGREELFPKQDLTRSVGWFTTLFPVRLMPSQGEMGKRIKSMKEQLRQTPRAGIGYGLLRYLHPNPEVRDKLTTTRIDVQFTYLGQFDNLRENTAVRLSDEATGSARAERGERESLLSVNAAVWDNCLRVEWTFSKNRHEPETITTMAKRFVSHLGSIIDHCLSSDVESYTPSDFPLANVDQRTLDKLLADVVDGDN
jgi:non-ribosomal peptide synthase protein (TIGR01720 family)